jgi:hypothetical protein
MSDDPTAEVPAQDPPAEPAADPKPEPAKDETDWKAQARKWEERAKANSAAAKRLEEFETANATELEKAQKIAEANETRAKAATERAVKAEVKALAVGFQDPVDAFGRLGDLSRFVSDDGEIDERAIAKELAEILKNNEHLAKREAKLDPGKPGSRPTESLRPGAAPAEPQRAGNLYDAVGAWATSQT